MLVPVIDAKVAFDGPGSDREVALSAAWTSRFTSVHKGLHGRWPGSSGFVRRCCAGLLHVCLGSGGRAPGVVDRISVDHHVCSGSGVAANRSSDLHTFSGFP